MRYKVDVEFALTAEPGRVSVQGGVLSAANPDEACATTRAKYRNAPGTLKILRIVKHFDIHSTD